MEYFLWCSWEPTEGGVNKGLEAKGTDPLIKITSSTSLVVCYHIPLMLLTKILFSTSLWSRSRQWAPQENSSKHKVASVISHSIDTHFWHFKAYNNKITSILHKREVCVLLVKQYEEALEEQMSKDEEEMRQEKAKAKKLGVALEWQCWRGWRGQGAWADWLVQVLCKGEGKVSH